MSAQTIANRYAKSLFDLAKEQSKIEVVHNDLLGLSAILKQNRTLKTVLANPVIHSFQKKKIMNAVFGNVFNALTLQFFELVIEKNREVLFHEIANAYHNRFNDFNEIIEAKVISASPLTQEQTATINTKLATALGKKIVIDNEVNTKLIAGFVIEINDIQLDESVKGKLDNIRKTFTK